MQKTYFLILRMTDESTGETQEDQHTIHRPTMKLYSPIVVYRPNVTSNLHDQILHQMAYRQSIMYGIRKKRVDALDAIFQRKEREASIAQNEVDYLEYLEQDMTQGEIDASPYIAHAETTGWTGL